MTARPRWPPHARSVRLAAVLGLVLTATACVATINTIGGRDEAGLRQLAARAQDTCRQRTGQVPPYPFTTDGCTLSPDCTWQSCCVEHDIVYWCGGSENERRQADERFRTCVADNGGRRTASLMYWAVRVGGSPWLPVWWRWGYGWPWPRGYTSSP